MTAELDAVVVGAGPNGLAAGIRLALEGHEVMVVEAAETIGGGSRSSELTLPGFVHDVCAAVMPLGAGSPFLRSLPLGDHGLKWIQPPVPAGHPLDDGSIVLLHRSVDDTAAALGRDAGAYRRLLGPLVERWGALAEATLGPVTGGIRHPVVMTRFGVPGMLSAHVLASAGFKDERARALFAGMAGHSILPLSRPFTSAFGLMLSVTGHAEGWPIPRGGAGRFVDAMASYLTSIGGRIETGRLVTSLEELPRSRVTLFDLNPAQVARIAGDRLPEAYRDRLRRFRQGPAAFKLDLAIDGPIPWRNPALLEAGTVHLGGTMDEIAAGETVVARGGHPERPYVLLAQQSLFDDTRAPEGRHTVWAYCHVPARSTVSMTDAIEAQIERFAPGFRERVLARHEISPMDYAAYNANYVGGDISGGAHDGLQLFARPVLRFNPYSTPEPDLFICSASTPPGGGVHGMSGYHGAGAALRRLARA
ncbi:MAG: NAD(P)/FAD-dependent oxidoreductase [Chloroflexi bacterium]|nr:NAD(P)/FAD-dependent oxidoreductase [Chloroflexota bacterium]